MLFTPSVGRYVGSSGTEPYPFDWDVEIITIEFTKDISLMSIFGVITFPNGYDTYPKRVLAISTQDEPRFDRLRNRLDRTALFNDDSEGTLLYHYDNNGLTLTNIAGHQSGGTFDRFTFDDVLILTKI